MLTENDLNFDEGRAVVELDNGQWLSIVNPDRQAIMDEAKMWSPSYLRGTDPWIDIQADDNSWEVAVMDEYENNLEDPDVIPEWKQWQDWDMEYVIFAFIPKDVVLDYINEHGGRNAQS